LFGEAGDDQMEGGRGDDWLEAGAGADTLAGDSAWVGDAGSDTLSGGSGADMFSYATVSQSSGPYRDVITDFSSAENDRLDFALVDANLNLSGRQDFVFIGQAQFSQTVGELRFDVSDPDRTLVEGDADGDGLADFIIELTGSHVLTSMDFIL